MNNSRIKNQEQKVSNLDKMMEEIQNQIIEGEKAVFSNKVIELYNAPLNFGKMEDADVHAMIHGWCGDTMELYLKVNRSIIKDISFQTDGCGATLAAGSMLTTMAKGKNIEEARKINEEDLLNALGGLPDENLHCATLGVNTLRKAIDDFLNNTELMIKKEKLAHEKAQIEKEESI